MIFDSFLSMFVKEPYLMDVGCGSGDWTLQIADKCAGIDGYEYSEKLVEEARKNAEKFSNVHFYQADAKEMCLEKEYDGALIQGMLMYIDNTDDLYKIFLNVYNHMKSGGFLCTRDTINLEDKEVIFLYNIKTGYNAVYWDKKVYYEQFKKAGFVLKKEYLLDEVTTRRLRFCGQGAIWVKP